VSHRPEEFGAPTALAETVRRHLGGDAGFHQALERADLALLEAVPGLSAKRALDWVRQAHGIAAPEEFLATPAARKVHDELMERLLAFAATAHGRHRLRLLGPMPDPAAATRHALEVMEHKRRVAGLDRDAVRRLLRRVKPFAPPVPRFEPTRLLLGESEAIQERLLKANLQKWAAVGGPADLEQARDYDLVLYLYEEDPDLAGLDNVLEVAGDAPPEAVVPEMQLAWVQANRDTLQAVGELAALLGRPTRAHEAIAIADEATREGAARVPVRRAVEEVRAILEARLRERVAAVSVSGAELLASLGRGPPPSIQRAIDATLAEARPLVAERTGHPFQPFLPSHPLELDEETVEQVERRLATRSRIDLHHARAKAAKRIAALRPLLERELNEWQEYDAPFALGCFAHHYDLHPAAFGPGIAFAASVHLDLADRPGVQRIAYRLGQEENVALLTGANSGGKTTLLEHLAQVAIMARWGLPVVGEGVEAPWVDELHYVTARRSLDAGAFESFLRGFLPIAIGPARRLVLADEVESVTELEASGRILAFFLDRLAGSRSLAVVVSHMAPQILRHCQAEVRVDGIEATGLDAENRLIVDRMPRMGVMARSTPEFIVQRLAATTSGAERQLFAELLAAFRPGEPLLARLPPRKGKRNPPSSATP
jgi:DNA mismatch repair protein MutS2